MAEISMTLNIRRVIGNEAKAYVDTFYAENGGGTKARPDDLFFLAYEGELLVGSVRFCVEESVPMLRGMMIHRDRRRQGIGARLLCEFVEFLGQEEIKRTHCLPFAHLENFYAAGGFTQIQEGEIPEFLRVRLAEYNQKYAKVICMKRD